MALGAGAPAARLHPQAHAGGPRRRCERPPDALRLAAFTWQPPQCASAWASKQPPASCHSHAPTPARPAGTSAPVRTQARIFLFRGFLTDAEVAHLIKTAEPRLDRSGVVNTESGHNEVDNIRTSYSMFFSRGEDAVVREVEERISRWTLMPVGSGEGLQVLRCECCGGRWGSRRQQSLRA